MGVDRDRAAEGTGAGNLAHVGITGLIQNDIPLGVVHPEQERIPGGVLGNRSNREHQEVDGNRGRGRSRAVVGTGSGAVSDQGAVAAVVVHVVQVDRCGAVVPQRGIRSRTVVVPVAGAAAGLATLHGEVGPGGVVARRVHSGGRLVHDVSFRSLERQRLAGVTQADGGGGYDYHRLRCEIVDNYAVSNVQVVVNDHQVPVHRYLSGTVGDGEGAAAGQTFHCPVGQVGWQVIHVLDLDPLVGG